MVWFATVSRCSAPKTSVDTLTMASSWEMASRRFAASPRRSLVAGLPSCVAVGAAEAVHASQRPRVGRLFTRLRLTSAQRAEGGHLLFSAPRLPGTDPATMILVHCAACAAPLGLSLGKKCGRCSTRYCGPACQEQHWKEGGHDKLCRKIKKAGGAEQYNANQKYTAAVTVAAEACADDTKGQTCYICTQALHWKTKEGLVRGCACRGTAGFAHVSCLAEQAKILVAEADGEQFGRDAFDQRWDRWHTCAACASNGTTASCGARSGGRAGRLMWVGRRGTNFGCMAMNLLGNGLGRANTTRTRCP